MATTTVSSTRAASGQVDGGPDDENSVRLCGRVSAPPQERVLPSGDHLVAFRLVVRRSGDAPLGSRATVDVIDVSCWAAATRRVALSLRAGDRIEISGALRRRFFRGPGQVQSRYDVEAATVRRLAKAGRPVTRKRPAGRAVGALD